MDHQSRWNPQTGTPFYPDHSSARVPDPNAVAYGRMPLNHEAVADQAWAASFVMEREEFLAESDAVYLGKAADGSYVDYIPVEVTAERIARGQERFNIFCATCHGAMGNGVSPVAERFIAKPVNLATAPYMDPTQRTARDGYIFEVIRNGVRNMPAYGHSIDPQDAWNIVMYVRALQKSHTGTLEDVPAGERDRLERTRPAAPAGPPAEAQPSSESSPESSLEPAAEGGTR
jgi:mono/diheme cytochrome c family protein